MIPIELTHLKNISNQQHLGICSKKELELLHKKKRQGLLIGKPPKRFGL